MGQSKLIKYKNVLFLSASHPKSGRILELYSDQPGVQFYTSNYIPDPNNTVSVHTFFSICLDYILNLIHNVIVSIYFRFIQMEKNMNRKHQVMQLSQYLVKKVLFTSNMVHFALKLKTIRMLSIM